LQETCDGRPGVDLNDAIQVANVHAEFKCRRRNDHAVAAFGERLLRPPSLVERQRGVDEMSGDAALPELRTDAMTLAALGMLPT
jgi:hypothetical protein